MSKHHDETRMAEEIIKVLPTGIARELSPERDAIRYAVRGDGIRLRTIVLNRKSLRKLIEDPAREVKVEYLQRDLLRAAGVRTEFRYPRPLLACAHAHARTALSVVGYQLSVVSR